MNFDNQTQLFTATPITLLWFVTTNWSSKQCRNLFNLCEFFLLCSELLVAITTTINIVLSLPRASPIYRNSPISKRFLFDPHFLESDSCPMEGLITSLGICEIEYLSVANVFWQAFQNKVIVDMLKLYLQLWRNIQTKLLYRLARKATGSCSELLVAIMTAGGKILCRSRG